MTELQREHVLLSLQRALLGEVSPALRGVAVEISDRVVKLRFYYDGTPSPADAESATSVVAEVAADLTGIAEVLDDVLRVDSLEQLSSGGTWVYRRRESRPS